MQDILVGNWQQLRHEIKMWWNKLTDTDLDEINGSYDILVSVLVEKYGYSAQRAEEEVQRKLGQFEKTHRALV